eukprot:2503655-Pyramimonas_sp.AAC.1
MRASPPRPPRTRSGLSLEVGAPTKKGGAPRRVHREGRKGRAWWGQGSGLRPQRHLRYLAARRAPEEEEKRKEEDDDEGEDDGDDDDDDNELSDPGPTARDLRDLGP